MRHIATLFCIMLLCLSMSAEMLSLDTLLDSALLISPALQSAKLAIEDAEIELKRTLYKESSLPPNTLKERKKAVENAYTSLEKTKKLVEEETFNTALSVIKAKHGLRQKEISLYQAKRDLEIAVVKFDRGTISLNELQGYEDKFTSSSEALEQNKESLRLAKEKLCLQIGLDLDTNVTVDSTLEPLILSISLDQLIDAHRRYDTSYLTLCNTVNLREKELQQMHEDNEALLDIRQKEISLEKAKIELKTKEISLITSSRTALSSYESQKRSLINTEAEVTKAKKRVEEANKQFEDGLISLINLEDIKFQSEISSMKLIEAKWELHLASLALKRLLEGGV